MLELIADYIKWQIISCYTNLATVKLIDQRPENHIDPRQMTEITSSIRCPRTVTFQINSLG